MKFQFKYLKLLFYLFLVVFTSCSEGATDYFESSYTVEVKNSSLSSDAGYATITISGVEGENFLAEIAEGSDWCSFSLVDSEIDSKEGVLTYGTNVLYVYFVKNSATEDRTATISFSFDGYSTEISFTQLASGAVVQPSYGWFEVPTIVENTNYEFTTHYTTVGGQKVRNFTLCLDKTRKAALWVAYPIHSIYLTGTGSRTDEWAFDPNIDASYQANCVNGSYSGSYDRGHQLPSADRLGTDAMNEQTFYMSNMTPQLDRLNQDMWAALETQVRRQSCSDTLYVVTGAYFENDDSYTYDKAGSKVPLPTHYFKLLLRTKTGYTGKAISECSASELQSIGFWVEHRSYGTDIPTSICTTVEAIEEITGFEFFPSVDSSVKKQNYPSEWGIN